MDATENEIDGLDASSFPTLKLLPKGDDKTVQNATMLIMRHTTAAD